MHQQLPLLLALVAAIVLIEMLATKLRIAYPVLLVIAGLLVSFVPGLPRVQIDPDMIFFIFLPPLLSDAAWDVSYKEMKKWWRMIGSFAFLVVLFSAFAVALLTNYFIPGFTLVFGILLGSIVSPPDAVSAGAIMKFVKLPRSTSAILEGESLLNDASSLIIFKFALIAVGTGQFIFHEALLDFSWMVLGGIGLGLAFGWIFMQAHKRLPTDAPSDIVFSIIEPYFLYWIAEQVHSFRCTGRSFGKSFSGQPAIFLFIKLEQDKGAWCLGGTDLYPEWCRVCTNWVGVARGCGGYPCRWNAIERSHLLWCFGNFYTDHCQDNQFLCLDAGHPYIQAKCGVECHKDE